MLEICKPLFLLTSPLKGGYGIFSHQKLQDFYNIPLPQNRAKITSLAHEKSYISRRVYSPLSHSSSSAAAPALPEVAHPFPCFLLEIPDPPTVGCTQNMPNLIPNRNVLNFLWMESFNLSRLRKKTFFSREMMFFASNPQVGTFKKNLSECTCLGVASKKKMKKKLTSE
jgi:hypothetical protein